VYGIQKQFEQQGKDRVVNVRSRASLYQALERLMRLGLVEVHETAVAAVLADEQPLEAGQPGEGALDHPAGAPAPEPYSVCRRALSEAMPRQRSSRRYLSWS
jgi:hypothetical protein